jgi:hypothetical protein
MDPNIKSMNKLILAKMREGDERMDAPQAVDEVRGMRSLAIPSSGALAPSKPTLPLPTSSFFITTRPLRTSHDACASRKVIHSMDISVACYHGWSRS